MAAAAGFLNALEEALWKGAEKLAEANDNLSVYQAYQSLSKQVAQWVVTQSTRVHESPEDQELRRRHLERVRRESPMLPEEAERDNRGFWHGPTIGCAQCGKSSIDPNCKICNRS